VEIEEQLANIGAGNRWAMSKTTSIYGTLKKCAVSFRTEILDAHWGKGWSESLGDVKEQERRLYTIGIGRAWDRLIDPVFKEFHRAGHYSVVPSFRRAVERGQVAHAAPGAHERAILRRSHPTKHTSGIR
jgi:hypothetical protein